MKQPEDISTKISLLNNALQRLKTQQTNVSIRSLAHRLSISPSYLSKILRGKKDIPAKLIAPLSKVFHLDLIETKELQRLVFEKLEQKKTSHATGIRVITSESPKYQAYHTMGSSDYFLLEKWFYIPLLNLATLADFSADVKYIRKKLGISEMDARHAVRELLLRGYLEKDVRGVIRRSRMKIRFSTDKSQKEIRNFHRMMIEKAVEALENPSQAAFENRLINGLSFAGHPKKLKEAQAIINDAIYKAAELLMEDEPTSAVYQINLQFFEITS